jgi:hypothetical protein
MPPPVALETKQAPSERGLPWLGILPALLRDAIGELSRVTWRHEGEIPIVHIGPFAVRLLTHPVHVPGHPPVRSRSQGNDKPHPGLRMQLVPITRSA